MPPSIFHSLLTPDLQLMIDEGNDGEMIEFCRALYPAVVAEVLEGMPPEVAWLVLSKCEPRLQADIFPFFPLQFQMQLVDMIDRQSLSRIIEHLPPDDRVDLLNRMDPEHVENLLPLVAQAERADIRKLLSYPEDSAGSIMTTEYAFLPADITVDEALRRLRHQAPSRETIYYIYVTDENRHLLGFLSLRKLITAPSYRKVSDLMRRDVISVRVDDDREAVAREIARYDFIAIPVVDHQNRLVGIVTHDDAADVLEEEATEDAHLLGAVAPLEDSYLATPLLILLWKRGIWLVVLLGAAFLTATVLGWYAPEEGSGWMVLFIPLVLASGGNAGSQSATLVIRTLALEESAGHRVPLAARIAWKEFRLGLMLGSSLALVTFVVASLLIGETSKSAVVGLTVLLVVVMGTVNGSMLPIGLRRLGADPALMSNPLIAALSDMLGVVIYYETAKAIVGA